MFEAYILELDRNLLPDEYEKLIQMVSAEKRERILRYHLFEDSQRCLLGDILIRKLVTKKFDLPNSQIGFLFNEYGKPFLAEMSGFHFNISHAGDYIACAICDTSVGIDVEMIKPIDMKIAERFFSCRETEYILSRPCTEQMAAFYEIWTRKEAYVKYMAKGLSIPLNTFSAIEPGLGVFFHRIISSETAICHSCASHRTAPSITRLKLSTALCGNHVYSKKQENPSTCFFSIQLERAMKSKLAH